METILNGIISAFSWVFLVLGKFFIGLTVFGLEFFVKLAQYNDYLNAPIVMVGWVMVRDVANMFFVVALLMIAFGTMLGIENYMWTKTLVKLILAAIFINFSNLIAGLFIDFAHVFTITFVNAIAGAAGGNLIQMFKLSEMLSMKAEGGETTNLLIQSFLGAISGFIFAAIAAGTMVAYLVVMVARVVVLWVLIVLSPLAFALQVIPQTEQYAKEWWEKFGKQVLVAPVMVFFLWLALATAGSGQLASNTDLVPEQQNLSQLENVEGTAGEKGNITVSLSAAKITTWNNMANFLVPIALLIVGLGVVQKLGVVGGGLAGGVVDFGKKVATIASGYALGRYIVGGAAKAGLDTVKNRATLPFRTAWQNIKGTYFGAAGGITAKGLAAEQKASAARAQISNIENAGKNLESNKNARDAINNELASAAITPERRQQLEAKKKDLEQQIAWGQQGETPEKQAKIQALQEEAKKAEDFALSGKARGNLGYRAVGWWARRGIKSEKHLKKSTGQAEYREKIAFKRVGAEAGGIIFNRRKSLFGRGGMIDAQDRVERGILEAEEMRSKGKDVEFLNKGRAATLGVGRQKWEGIDLKGILGMRMEQKGLTVADMIAGHEARGRGWEGIQKAVLAGARMAVDVKVTNALDKAKTDPNLMALIMDKRKPAEDDPEEQKFAKEVAPVARALYYEEQAKALEAQQKEAHSNALGALAATGIGADIYKEIAEAEVGAKVGEDFIKSIKSDEVRKKFEGAKKLLDDIKPLKDTNPEEFSRQLASLQEQNKFVAAIHTATEAKVTEDAAKAAREDADKSHTEVETMEYENEFLAARTPEQEAAVERTQAMRAADAKARTEAAKKYLDTAGGEEVSTREAAEELKKLQEQKAAGLITDEELQQKIDANPYMARAFYSKSAEAIQKEIKAGEAQVGAAVVTTAKGGVFIERANKADQQLKDAEDFVKRKQNDDLAKNFEEAQKNLKNLLNQGLDTKQLEEVLKKGVYTDKKTNQQIKLGAYEKALAMGEISALSATSVELKKRQAADEANNAFIHKPMYGSTKPSTVLAEHGEKRMTEYRRLERRAAMFKAMETMGSLMAQRRKGKKLDVHQEAELYAVTQFLSEEAWIDDGHEQIRQNLLKYQSKQKSGQKLSEDEQAIVDSWAEVGWVKKDADGSFELLKGAKQYGRQEAQDLQALGATGGDTSLLRAHHETQARLAQMNQTTEEAKEASYTAKVEDLRTKDTGAKKIYDDSFNKAATAARESGDFATDDEIATYSHAQAREELIKRRRDVFDAIDKSFASQIKSYWDAADVVLKEADGGRGIDDMKNRTDMQARYDEHYDMLQSATRLNTQAGVKTGHGELMYNQNHDSDGRSGWDGYRFMTTGEGDYETWAELIKHPVRSLLSKLQYHHFGTLDQESLVLDDFLYNMHNHTTGRIEKTMDTTSTPDRTKKGWYYIQKEENATTSSRKKKIKKIKKIKVEVKDDTGNVVMKKGKPVTEMRDQEVEETVETTFAALGGDRARRKFAEEDVADGVSTKTHMYARGLVKEILAGAEGWAVGWSSVGKHINEAEAKAGVIRTEVEGEDFETMAELIGDMLKDAQKKGNTDYYKKHLASSGYRGSWAQAERELVKLRDQYRIKTSNFRKNPPKGGKKGAEAAAEAAEIDQRATEGEP